MSSWNIATLDVYGHLFAYDEDRTRAAVDAEFTPGSAHHR